MILIWAPKRALKWTLDVIEERFPGIRSPEFELPNRIELGIQFHVAVILLMSGSDREHVADVDAVLKRIEQQYPTWEGLSGLIAAVRHVYGHIGDAIRLALGDLDGRQGWLYVWDWPIRYGHIGVYKRPASEPAVAART